MDFHTISSVLLRTFVEPSRTSENNRHVDKQSKMLVLLFAAFLVFSVGEATPHNGDIILDTQNAGIFGDSNDTMMATRYGIFFRIPGLYQPPTTSTLPACAATCCLTSCAAPATACMAATTPGALGTCTPATPAGTFCRSIAATCLAAVCTLPTTCTATVPCANAAPSTAAPWIC